LGSIALAQDRRTYQHALPRRRLACRRRRLRKASRRGRRLKVCWHARLPWRRIAAQRRNIAGHNAWSRCREIEPVHDAADSLETSLGSRFVHAEFGVEIRSGAQGGLALGGGRMRHEGHAPRTCNTLLLLQFARRRCKARGCASTGCTPTGQCTVRAGNRTDRPGSTRSCILPSQGC